MTRSEHAANIHLTAAAQRVHVGAHFAKRGPVRSVYTSARTSPSAARCAGTRRPLLSTGGA